MLKHNLCEGYKLFYFCSGYRFYLDPFSVAESQEDSPVMCTQASNLFLDTVPHSTQAI